MSNSVLVVEDHEELRTLLDHVLTKWGYDVLCAASIVEAVAILNEIPDPCLVLWDPITLPMSGPLIAQTGRRGIHLATIPVGITSMGQTAGGVPVIAKRLTSLDAVLSVLKEHCTGPEMREPA